MELGRRPERGHGEPRGGLRVATPEEDDRDRGRDEQQRVVKGAEPVVGLLRQVGRDLPELVQILDPQRGRHDERRDRQSEGEGDSPQLTFAEEWDDRVHLERDGDRVRHHARSAGSDEQQHEDHELRVSRIQCLSGRWEQEPPGRKPKPADDRQGAQCRESEPKHRELTFREEGARREEDGRRGRPGVVERSVRVDHQLRRPRIAAVEP